MTSRIFILCIAFVLTACGTKSKINKDGSESLKFLGEMTIPNGWDYNETLIGGLSGIDYNAKTNTFYAISDDRSIHNPARFYEFSLEFDEETSQPINFEFLNVTTLKNESGNEYTNAKVNPNHSIDPEDIRFNPNTNSFLISTEGERLPKYNVYRSPSILEINSSGQVERKFKIPTMVSSNVEEKGIRRNGTFEGIAYSKDYKKVYASLEEPLYEDGLRATTTNKAMTRFFEFSNQTKENTAQYAYEIDAVVYPPEPLDKFSINGITSILDAGDKKLYVVERSYSDGRQPCSIRIYLADFSNATNVKSMNSINGKNIQPAKKTLLLDMDNLGRYVDNIEGISYGPTLPNGNKSLMLISDDNFSEKQQTQIYIFEILK